VFAVKYIYKFLVFH